MRIFNNTDKFFMVFDNFIKTNFGGLSGSGRKNPALEFYKNSNLLNDKQKNLSQNLMRVNHSGEVAAQALYQGQMLLENDVILINYLKEAANEEADHLSWTSEQLDFLESKKSFFNPLWYGGAFFLGVLSRGFSKSTSMGFLAETERQVVSHLEEHLKSFPVNDIASNEILKKMLIDESTHADWAENSDNYIELPIIIKSFMRIGSKVMIVISQKI
jgi:ubiquinone biosynthesis monooxygenase Coq7